MASFLCVYFFFCMLRALFCVHVPMCVCGGVHDFCTRTWAKPRGPGCHVLAGVSKQRNGTGVRQTRPVGSHENCRQLISVTMVVQQRHSEFTDSASSSSSETPPCQRRRRRRPIKCCRGTPLLFSRKHKHTQFTCTVVCRELHQGFDCKSTTRNN